MDKLGYEPKAGVPAWLLGVAAGFGLLAGFFLALIVDPFTVKIKHSPFAPEAGLRITKGKDWWGGSAWKHFEAGKIYEGRGWVDSAASRYRKSIGLAPDFAYPYSGLGRMLLSRGEMGEAEKSFRIAIALMESDPEDYRSTSGRPVPVESAPFDWLAELFYQKGAEDSALMALQYGIENHWKTDRMDLLQGRLWESRGFLRKADSVYRDLVAKEPGNPDYAEALATLGFKPARPEAARSGDPGAVFALSLLDPIARQNPGNAPLWDALGQAYYRRGLFARAVECFDSSIRFDPLRAGMAEKRNSAVQAWMRDSERPKQAGGRRSVAAEDQVAVVIPGSNALLGTYSVPWGSTPEAVRTAYPKKEFQMLPSGSLMDVFYQEGVKHEYLLAFKQGRLWGIRVFVTDSAGVGGDLFGKMIRTKTKISGEGRGTGEASCPGARSFQGIIWENDDTFEFMAQFGNQPNQVRLARMARDQVPANRRLCELVPYLNPAAWQ